MRLIIIISIKPFMAFFFIFIMISSLYASYCTFTGCAPNNNNECECLPLISYCDKSNDLNGICILTSAGMWTIGAIISILIILILILCICVCCCCFCKKTKKGDITHIYTSPPNQYQHHSIL